MEKLTRRRYTIGVQAGGGWAGGLCAEVASAVKSLGIVEQTLANRVKADKAG